jgi:hypothetical protein
MDTPTTTAAPLTRQYRRPSGHIWKEVRKVAMAMAMTRYTQASMAGWEQLEDRVLTPAAQLTARVTNAERSLQLAFGDLEEIRRLVAELRERTMEQAEYPWRR